MGKLTRKLPLFCLALPNYKSPPSELAERAQMQSVSRRIPVKLFKPPLKLPNFEIRQYWHERHHADAANKWMRTIIKNETNNMAHLQ